LFSRCDDDFVALLEHEVDIFDSLQIGAQLLR
jgi:hypothetical protein